MCLYYLYIIYMYVWERFTNFHLNLVIQHPAMGCSYVQRKRPSTGKPRRQNYRRVTQIRVVLIYYQVRASHCPKRIAFLPLV